MKAAIILISVSLLGLSACTQNYPEVPDSGRVVVGPSGSTDRGKSWSTMTKEEGEAKLGPLGGQQR